MNPPQHADRLSLLPIVEQKKQKLAKQVERLLTVYVRDDIHQLIENVARVANETFSKFISGMVIEAIVLLVWLIFPLRRGYKLQTRYPRRY